MFWRRNKAERITILVHCFNAPECELNLEPEGSVQTVRKDEWLRVEVAPQPDGYIEVSYRPRGLSIHAGTGWETRVWNKSGVEKPL